MSVTDNLVMFPFSYSLLKWSVVWFPLVIMLYRWIAKRKSFKSSVFKEIPALKTNFYSIYGHLGPLPSRSVMNKMSLSVTSYVLQIASGYARIFEKEPLFELKFVNKSVIILKKPKPVEELLSSNVVLEKSSLYNLIHPWLGTGLLTSHGTKWKTRRKLLTHSFHFDILKEFLPSFDEQSKVLVGILKRRSHEEWIDIVRPITLCSLDIICDTTLGTHVGAQTDSESEYVAAVLRASKTVMERIATPIFHSGMIFALSKLGRQFKNDVDCLHTFTRKVIAEKKEALKAKETNFQGRQSEEFSTNYKGKRKALMDLLLEVHMSNPEFTEEDIREEIDTFAFEGHDTTSMGLSWALYLIGLHPEVQSKIHEELDEIYGDDQDRSVTVDDLKEMKYLEIVLKESLRLYPSVPFFGRRTNEDLNLCGYKIKKGGQIAIFPYILHRDPDVFPNPEKFDPDRFLPENCLGRNPFAYVPFSAGPRNCIGQRFAMMEEKTVISTVLRNFRIKSLEHRDKMFAVAEIILRCERPLKLKFIPR